MNMFVVGNKIKKTINLMPEKHNTSFLFHITFAHGRILAQAERINERCVQQKSNFKLKLTLNIKYLINITGRPFRIIS